MKKQYLTLASRIRQELSELEKGVQRAQQAWHRALTTGDNFYIDSTALSLHGIYTGIERIFELIAVVIDESKPQGENWHQELVRQMAIEISSVRPPVITPETRDSLDGYRGFRHVVRNIYSFNLNPSKMQYLLDELPVVFARMKTELIAFASFLETQGKQQR